MNELGLLRETLADYRKACQTLSDLPELSLVAVRREPKQKAADITLFERVTTALAAGPHGWARFRSELGWTGHPPPCFEQSGPPIMAEWLDCDGTAYRLTPAPNAVGEALIVSVRDRVLRQDEGLAKGEIPALRQHVEVLALPRVNCSTHIAYEVYWGLPRDGSLSATRRLFDRFAGFVIENTGA